MAWLGGTTRRGGPEFLTPNLLSSSQTAGLQDPAGATLLPRPRPSVHRPAQESAARGLSTPRGVMDVSAALCTTSLFPTNTGRWLWPGLARGLPAQAPPPREDPGVSSAAAGLSADPGARGPAPSSPVPLRARNPARPPHTLGAPAESGWLLGVGCARH